MGSLAKKNGGGGVLVGNQSITVNNFHYWKKKKTGIIYTKKILGDKQTYNFPIEIIPCIAPLLPPKTGSKANNKPTAQS
jgi:hypothetical protein